MDKINDEDTLPGKSGMKPLNGKNLWRLETIGDLDDEHPQEIQQWIPITLIGARDYTREPKFCSLMDFNYKGGHVKLRFMIPGKSLEEAVANFLKAAEDFGFATLERLDGEYRRALLASGGTIGQRRPN